MVRFQCDGKIRVTKTWKFLVFSQKSRRALPDGKILLVFYVGKDIPVF